jgi:hypothetical protein
MSREGREVREGKSFFFAPFAAVARPCPAGGSREIFL